MMALKNAKEGYNSMLEEFYVERVRHVRSDYRTNDEELVFAKSIPGEADMIEVITTVDDKETATQVNVYTEQAVYHFQTFRADYIGHASRTLVDLLLHFKVSLPIEFVVNHKTFTVYLKGSKIVVGEAVGGSDKEPSEDEEQPMGDNEFPIAFRNGVFCLVIYFEEFLSASVAESLSYLAEYYNMSPIEVIENAVTAMFELRLEDMEEENLKKQHEQDDVFEVVGGVSK